MSYVVFIVSMRPRWLRYHPNRARLRIKIAQDTRFDQLRQTGSFEGIFKGWRKYRSWRSEEGFRSYPSEREAWQAAYNWKSELVNSRREVDLIDDEGCQLYIFQMERNVWREEARFKEFEHQPEWLPSTKCCYVGVTKSAPEERYRQHRSEDHHAHTIWGRNYFLEPFDRAYLQELLKEYQSEGYQWTGMKRSEALNGEEHLTRWLQTKGIAAYFA